MRWQWAQGKTGVFSSVFSAAIAPDGLGGNATIVDLFSGPFSKSGSAVRLTLVGSSSAIITAMSVWIGKQGTGNAYNFDGSQVQITVGGLSSFSIPLNGTVVSDSIPYNFVAANIFLVAMQATGGMGGFGNPPAVTQYFASGLSEAAVTNKTAGYTQSAACRLVSNIEVFG